MRTVNLAQGSEDWLEWRKKGIGGSDAYILMGDVPYWATPADLLAEKKGRKYRPATERMLRGTRLEPTARELYIARTGTFITPVCVISDMHPWRRASLDGISDDGTLIVEIKCPNDAAHKRALEGVYPRYYRAQLQHNLSVADTAVKLHYVSYTDSPYFGEEDQLAPPIEIYPDREYQADLIQAERRFYEQMTGEHAHP